MPWKNIRNWDELTLEVIICPFCDYVNWKDDLIIHLENHFDKIAKHQTVIFSWDKSDFEPTPRIILICSYCNNVPPEIFKGTSTTDQMSIHQRDNCLIARNTIPHVLKFLSIIDEVSILNLIDRVKNDQIIEGICCLECSEVLIDKPIFLQHYVEKHIKLLTNEEFLNLINKGNSQISPDILDIVHKLKFESNIYTDAPEEIKSRRHYAFIDHEEHETQENDVNKMKEDLTEKIHDTLDAQPHRFIESRPDVPHPRSILKEAAGITEVEYKPYKREEIKKEPIITKYPPRISKVHHRRIELRFSNVQWGHLSLAYIRPLLTTIGDKVTLITDEGDIFSCIVDKKKRLLVCENSTPADWFKRNSLFAGCYLHLELTTKESEIEISYIPKETIIKKCLIAEWDENEQRVRLHYENKPVNIECSEHLFRSSVNLNLEDQRILNAMARLYGSIFDVLYLGMRDLFSKGEDIIHYRNLHNMVVDKRLHPLLGSVFVELSKNNFCFERIGGGYWRFHPDERIERIIPRLLSYRNEREVHTIKSDRDHTKISIPLQNDVPPQLITEQQSIENNNPTDQHTDIIINQTQFPKNILTKIFEVLKQYIMKFIGFFNKFRRGN